MNPGLPDPKPTPHPAGSERGPKRVAGAAGMNVGGAISPPRSAVLTAARERNAALSSAIQAVAQTCLCVFCPGGEPICHYGLSELATLSPETQSSPVTTCDRAP